MDFKERWKIEWKQRMWCEND